MRPVQWRHCQLALAQLPVRLGITDAMRVTGAGGSSAISASNPTLLARPCVCNFQLPENESGAGEQGPFVRQEMRVVCDASQQGEHPIRAPSCDLGGGLLVPPCCQVGDRIDHGSHLRPHADVKILSRHTSLEPLRYA